MGHVEKPVGHPLGVPRTRGLRHRESVLAKQGRVRRWRKGAVEALEAPVGSRDRSLAGKARIRARRAAGKAAGKAARRG